MVRDKVAKAVVFIVCYPLIYYPPRRAVEAAEREKMVKWLSVSLR